VIKIIGKKRGAWTEERFIGHRFWNLFNWCQGTGFKEMAGTLIGGSRKEFLIILLQEGGIKRWSFLSTGLIFGGEFHLVCATIQVKLCALI